MLWLLMDFRSSSISYHREKIFALFPPPPTSICASSNQQMTCKRPLSHSLYPGYKSGLRTPVQSLFSLEGTRCSNSISHSNKLYLSFVLSHIWKFFSNPCADHDVFGGPYRELRWPTSFLKRTLCQEASAVEAIGEFWPGLPSGVFQRPHYPLSPSRRCPNGWQSLLCPLSN